MKRNTVLVSALALGLSPALAQAGGEVVIPAPPPPPPVTVAPVAPPPMAAAPVVEDTDAGPYIALYGGASWLNDADVRIGADEDEDFFDDLFEDADDADGELDFDTGWVAGAAVGYTADVFGFAPRLELDGSYRRHGVDSLALNDLDDEIDVDVNGDIWAASGLLNAWFDVPVMGFRPYAGGGLGAAYVSADDINTGSGLDASFDDDDTVFAWQLGAGIGFELTEELTATLDYRWFNTDDVSFTSDDGTSDVEIDYSTHNVLAGLRYTF